VIDGARDVPVVAPQAFEFGDAVDRIDLAERRIVAVLVTAAQSKQAPDATQAPKAVQAPTQSPVQKGGATASADSGYRTFSYQPGTAEPVRYSSPSSARSYRPAWTNAATKALGQY
jgi:hypothetical protein